MPGYLLKNLAQLYLPLYQCESDKMKIVYAGYSWKKRNYSFALNTVDNCKRTFLGRCWFWKLPSIMKSRNLDIVVSEVSRISFKYFHGINGYILPVWVQMRINIDRPVSDITKRSVSHFPDVLKRIRKYNLSYEILNDEESFNSFNQRYYLPYIAKRHGDEAILNDLEKIWKSSPSPLLMAIKEEGITVAGALIQKKGNSLYGLHLGMLDGDEKYLRHGVVGAIYYYALLEGHRLGCRHLYVGTSRPFFADGLTNYKMGLGAEFVLEKDTMKECIWLGVNHNSATTKEFMHSNPFIYLNKENKLVKSTE
jgi:hypothetical protein